jgi:ABC-type phosphonate transport system ATPase subunit
MFNKDELRLLELGLHHLRQDQIREIQWAREQKKDVPLGRTDQTPGEYEAGCRSRLDRAKELIMKLRELEV